MSKALRNVFVIPTSFFFIFFGFGTAQQYLVILFTAQGRGHLALASLFLLYGAFLLTGIVVSKVVPLFGGLKKSLLAGAFSYALFVFSVALNNTFILLAASVVIGVGAALLWVCSGQVIIDSSDAETSGKNLSYQQIGQFSGNIAGMWAGGYFVGIFSLESMYGLLAVVIFVGFLILFLLTPIREEVQERPFKPYYMFASHMLALFPLVFGTYFLLAQTFTAMNLIIVSLLGVGAIPLIISFLKVSNIAGSFSSGALSSRYRKAVMLTVLCIVSLSGITVFTLAHTFVPLLAGAILLGFSTAAVYPVTLSWIKETLPPEEYLYALGTFHVYSNVGVLSAVCANLWLPAGASFIPGIAAFILAFFGILFYSKTYQQSSYDLKNI